MSGQQPPNRPDRDSDRAFEERYRRRKQEEITRLRGALALIPRQIYDQFIGNLGDSPKNNAGQIVEWQLINISTQAIKYYYNLSESQKQEIVKLSSKVASLQKTVNEQAVRIAQTQQSNIGISGWHGQGAKHNYPGGNQGM